MDIPGLLSPSCTPVPKEGAGSQQVFLSSGLAAGHAAGPGAEPELTSSSLCSPLPAQGAARGSGPGSLGPRRSVLDTGAPGGSHG